MVATEVMGIMQRMLSFLLFFSLLHSYLTDFSYIGSSFNLQPSIQGDKVHVYYRAMSSPCSSGDDELCSLINCTASNTWLIDNDRNSTTCCQLEGEAVHSIKGSRSFHLRVSGCCWTPALSPQGTKLHVPFLLFMTTDLGVRSDTGKVNIPPKVALSPPLRIPQNCISLYKLSVLDEDGDTVRCRYASHPDQACTFCETYPFLHLDENNCTIRYNSFSLEGTYALELLIEDYPKETVLLKSSDGVEERHPYSPMDGKRQALSSVPLQFTLTVGKPVADCLFGINRPEFSDPTPLHGENIAALPYDDISFTISSFSSNERIKTITVLGPDGLQKSEVLRTKINSVDLTSVNISWSMPDRDILPFMPACFIAETISGLQSEPRCIWIGRIRPTVESLGTELQCLEDQMSLYIPKVDLPEIKNTDLQLNDPKCSVQKNSTHFIMDIPLLGCGTKFKEDHSFLIFANKVTNRHENKVITRVKAVAIPIICKYTKYRNSSSKYILKDSLDPKFGNITFDLMLGKEFTATSKHINNVLTDLNPANQLVISVVANSNQTDVDLIVESCQAYKNDNISVVFSFIEAGCFSNDTVTELTTGNYREKAYSVRLTSVPADVSQMFIKCNVKLCKSELRSINHCPPACGFVKMSSTRQPLILSKVFQITAGPVLIQKDTVSSTHVAAIVVGSTLGGVVCYVVFLLVKKSFYGIPYRHKGLRTAL
ncbi:uncharacterized protein LOC122791269 [Protopterus annectens]|uniref:uncharacterized protein LOC122791269 n=1 Tax=Protopterus annectens TaxID=7888 RepID=UPI001CFBEA28|nr:uncharacterized protein LOC122791269 [Protopterus annectens]